MNRRHGVTAAVGALVLAVSSASAASSTSPTAEPEAPGPEVAATTVSNVYAKPSTVDVDQAITNSRSRTQDRRQVASPTRPGSRSGSDTGAKDIPFAALYAYETAA